MKHLYLNLKRFDIPVELGGVNRIAPVSEWGSYIVKNTQEALKKYNSQEAEFVQFFPEGYILSAAAARDEDSPVQIGCQGVYRMDAGRDGFGAFTTNCPAAAAVAMGASVALIGHCEERNDKMGIMEETGTRDTAAVNHILNQEIKRAVDRGMKVLYCIGEKSEEQERWQEVLGEQLRIGLEGVDKTKVVIGYEPIWSIGPGKIPALDGMVSRGRQIYNAEQVRVLPPPSAPVVCIQRTVLAGQTSLLSCLQTCVRNNLPLILYMIPC